MVQSEDIPLAMTSELGQEILRVQIDLSFSCWMENKGSPSYHDVLREVLSTSILSNSDRIYIKYLLDKPELIDIVDKVNPIPVVQKSAIEKPANYPCKNLPDVACQDTIRPSQAEIVEPKSPNKSTKTKSSTSTLGGQQNKGTDAGCIATGLTGSTTGLTGSSRILQNKSKLKMVKPKNPRLVFGKPLNPKAVTSIKRKSRSPFLEIFRLNPKKMMLVGQNIQTLEIYSKTAIP